MARDSFALLNARELLWARMVGERLLGERLKRTDLAPWSLDVTRLPYRIHWEYLRGLYLDNALAHGNYPVVGHAVALSDARLPTLVVGALKDHISPWRPVYELHLPTLTDITFALARGGHNAGIASEPVHAGRCYRVARRAAGHHYVDPDSWIADAQVEQGCWWPACVHWLDRHSGQRIPARRLEPSDAHLGDAPGSSKGISSRSAAALVSPTVLAMPRMLKP